MKTETVKLGDKEITTTIDKHSAIDRAISRAAIDVPHCGDEEVRRILFEHLRRLLEIELQHVAPEADEQQDAPDLQSWFGLDRAAWCVLPRVLMEAMPQDWQQQMASLLFEWDATWATQHLPTPYVVAREGGRMVRWPDWVVNYRHPNQAEIEAVRARGDE